MLPIILPGITLLLDALDAYETETDEFTYAKSFLISFTRLKFDSSNDIATCFGR